MSTIQTTKRALRRFLLETQLLLGPREEVANSAEGLTHLVLRVIRQLECVQVDPVSVVGPNQHLVLAARIAGYDHTALNALLREYAIFEYVANAACIIPMEDYPIFEPIRQRMRMHTEDGIEKLRPVVEEVLRRLESEGPLPAKSFESEHRVHGYWDNVNEKTKTKATSHALNLLMDAALIRIVGREGNQRLFDIVQNSVPLDLLLTAERIDAADALDTMLQKYFRAYRVFEPSDPRLGWQRLSAQERREAIESRVRSGDVVPVEVSGVKQRYYILASDMERFSRHAEEDHMRLSGADAELPVRFLPPLDNLLWSRRRLEDLFDFEYRWEIYTPAVKRKFGPYAMPILAGDRLIGRMDSRLDRTNKHLAVQLLQIDSGIEYTANLKENVHRELERFAHSLGADTVSVERNSIGK
ncbi:winged helix-turn-helix domain-containing protein [Cohnella terricola]|uniref:Winged helix-turn-helix domain-containing protein n=1 Tax=Cohnella terricola TaxID=1289167 RepID=A0A559JT14_9BACL|nr:crosslink repair DNA glycosylase YcaQ family protein [Cohnella terricola]TVY03022.1 winged helix-turn-helix domain-containing protein [Cohnella terricola]